MGHAGTADEAEQGAVCEISQAGRACAVNFRGFDVSLRVQLYQYRMSGIAAGYTRAYGCARSRVGERSGSGAGRRLSRTRCGLRRVWFVCSSVG